VARAIGIPEEPTVTSESRATILVVDDVPSQRLAIEAALTQLDERVIAVGSGAEALRRLLGEDVAVILLDVNMPGMDGFETASLIRQRPRSRHTPIIFLTANPDEVAAARAYSLGAVDYIFAPFPADVLRAKVKVFVDLSKMHDRIKREAEQRIALSREQAARAAAEDESRRLRVLAEASGILTRSLEPASLVADLLALLVPLLADLSVVVLVDASGQPAESTWLDAAAGGQVSREPIPGGQDLEARLARVIVDGEAETLTMPDGQVRGVVLPLVRRGRTFGAMASTFVQSSRHYRDAELDLIRDIAGRAAIALDNSRLYQEIQERDRQKDEFLAMLSHELRNPLGAIATAAQLLELADLPPENATRVRDVIKRQSAHLARLVDDLLDVARLTTGRIAVMRVPIDLSDVVRRALETLRMSGRLTHHTVNVNVEPALVEADFARMDQVVTNLLVNALKYTAPGGRIDVEVCAEGNDAVLRVHDTGIGIDAELLPRLFDLFAQARRALDRPGGGLGVGLALVRRLVELHGGRVEAASEGPGRGSTFTVRLPRLSRPSSALRPRPAAPACERTPLRILVVEDDRDNREMLRAVLELGGHEVHEVADGLQALRLAGLVRPQLALIDIGLPGLDGLDVASRLRATVEGDAMFLVAVTGYGQEEDRRKAIEAGFDRHLTKPIDFDRLDEVLLLAAQRCLQDSVVKPPGAEAREAPEPDWPSYGNEARAS
jgi:signal transduction histidine kinase